MEIEKTAHPLETNAHANFPMADNAAYQCMENMGTYGYTKWTCSQSLTVLERTISDLQA